MGFDEQRRFANFLSISIRRNPRTGAGKETRTRVVEQLWEFSRQGISCAGGWRGKNACPWFAQTLVGR